MTELNKDKQKLDLIIDPEVYGSPEAQLAQEQLGIDDKDIQKYQLASNMLTEDPLDKDAVKARNQVYDKIAAKRPATEKDRTGGIGFMNRFAIKSLISDSPQLQREYLAKKGFQTRIVDGEVQVKKPDDINFSPIDPEGFDLFDVTDILGDVVEGAIVGTATTLGAGLGVPAALTGGLPAPLIGGLAAGSVAAGGVEAVRQSIAKYAGLRDELNPWKMGEVAAFEGMASIALPAVGKYLKNKAEAGFEIAKEGVGRIKDTATEISDQLKKEGLEPLFAQLTDSKRYRELFRMQIDGKPNFYSDKVKRKVNESFDKIRDDTKILMGGDDRGVFEHGEEARDAIASDLSKILMPGEMLYASAKKHLKDAGRYMKGQGRDAIDKSIDYASKMVEMDKDVVKEAIFQKPLLKITSKWKKKFTSDAALSDIDKFERQISRVDSVDKLKTTITELGNMTKDKVHVSPQMGQMAAELRIGMQATLSEAYKKTAKLIELNNIYRTNEELSRALSPVKIQRIKKSLTDNEMRSIFKYSGDMPSMTRISIDKLQNTISSKINTLIKSNSEKVYIDDLPHFSSNLQRQLDMFSYALESSIKGKKDLPEGVISLRPDLTGLTPKGIKAIEPLLSDLRISIRNFDKLDQSRVDVLAALSNVKEADQLWAEGANLVKTLTSKSGRKEIKGTVRQAMQKFIDGTADDDLVKKVLNFADFNKAIKVRKLAPQTFETLRKAEVARIFEKAFDEDPFRYTTKLKTQLKNMSPQKMLLLFGKEGSEKLKAFKLFLDTFPGDANPSHTARTLQEYLREDWSKGVKEIAFDIARKLGTSIEGRRTARELKGMEDLMKGVKPGTLVLMEKIADIYNYKAGKVPVAEISVRGASALTAGSLLNENQANKPTLLP